MAQNPKIKPYSGDLGWVDPCPRMLTLNTTIAPWDKKEMRHALSYAMNRRQIVDVVYEGAGGDSAVSNFIFPTYKALQPYRDAAADILAPLAEYNPDKSHQLIESQGYTMGGDWQVRRSGRHDAVPRRRRAAIHGAVGTHGRPAVAGGRRRRQSAAHRVGHLPRSDRARQVHGRRRLGWLRQRRRAMVRHEPLQQDVRQSDRHARHRKRRQHEQRGALVERRVLGADGPDGQACRSAIRGSWTCTCRR